MVFKPLHCQLTRGDLQTVLICLAIFSVIAPPVLGEAEIPYLNWDLYEGWDINMVSKVGVGLFPTIEIPYKSDSSSSKTLQKATTDHFASIYYFPQDPDTGDKPLLVGYVGGKNYNVLVLIGGKKAPGDDFASLKLLTPAEGGLFVWAIPDDLQDLNYYQAMATVNGLTVKSNIAQVTSSEPQKDLITEIPTSIPVIMGTESKNIEPTPEKSATKFTSLTLSASTLSPNVGDEVRVSGRLTDSTGRGVPNVPISINAPDWGDPTMLPLVTTKTDEDGAFEAMIQTTEPGVVPVQASFAGNDQFLQSTSNTLTFTAMEYSRTSY